MGTGRGPKHLWRCVSLASPFYFILFIPLGFASCPRPFLFPVPKISFCLFCMNLFIIHSLLCRVSPIRFRLITCHEFCPFVSARRKIMNNVSSVSACLCKEMYSPRCIRFEYLCTLLRYVTGKFATKI